jgi:Ran GTPase-activating protein (RanGAP) involved in mRNA processing and transport
VIASIIESDSSIRILNISGHNFLDSGIAVIARALIKNNSITDFDVSKCDEENPYYRSSESGMLPNTFSAMIKSNTNIKRLNLSSIFMSDDCMRLVTTAIQTNQTITELDISENRVTRRGISALARVISANSSIVNLRMWHIFDTSIQSQDSNSKCIHNFLGAFKSNSTITDLSIDISGMQIEDIYALARMIKINTSIVKLHIFYMFVDGLHLIFNALAQNLSLTEFKSCVDGMDDVESLLLLSKALSNMIRFNSTIVKLDLSKSNFSNESLVISIAVALTHNTRIQELNLNECCIKKAGGAALANMLSFNTTILRLHQMNSNWRVCC